MEDFVINYEDIEQSGYTKIRNHGMIANNRTAGIISMNGTVDWLCLPNFSSDPVFDCILDKNKGGYFKTKPVNYHNLKVKQAYISNTMILETTFMDGDKPILKLTDFLPAINYSSINFPEMHRLVESFEDPIDVKVELKATLDYRMSPVKIILNHRGAVYKKNSKKIGIYSEISFSQKNGVIEGTLNLKPNKKQWIVISYNMSDDELKNYKSDMRLEETKDYWLAFTESSSYKGILRDVALRSGITLRGLFYDPSGLMVASPTSSLPECIGGERNWDYRYSWIRDTSYVVEALSMLGLKRVATNYLYDMMEIVEKSDDLKVLYGIDPRDNLEEFEIDYEGYMGSSPVRMGNLASKQFQLDVYGSIINAIFHLASIGGTVNAYLWDFVVRVLERIKLIWRNPDSSIWEFRTQPRDYTYSKVMCWMGLNRGIKLGKMLNYRGSYEEWEALRDEIKADVLEKGIDSKTGSLVQYYGGDMVDGSLLRVPLTGFLDSNDPIMLKTVERIEKELMTPDYLIRRYNNDDGLMCKDNAFLLLSFWYVEVLLEQNKMEKAEVVLKSLITRGNHLHLFSEEIDLETGELIGNFPQAITHLGVIRAIYRLNEKIKNQK
jgi:glucoamylase